MAKALLFLKASSNNARTLLATVQSLADQSYSTIERKTSTCRVMASLEDDPLCNRPRPNHLADVTVEIKSQPGQPLTPALDSWGDIVGRLGHYLNAEQSLALTMCEQRWRPAPPQPICYHYLMVRREDFSAADYYDYYLHYHRRFGLVTPGIEAYSQNIVDQASSKKLCRQLGVGFYEVSSISEMHLRDMSTFLNSPAMMDIGPAAGEDEARFVDRQASVMFCSEVTLTLGDLSTINESVFS